MIHNYTKKKARKAARLALIPDTNRCELFETLRDEDTDEVREVLKGTATTRDINGMIDAVQSEKDAFLAQYQPRLDALNKRIQNLRDIKADVKLATGE